ncbi:MAG: glycosyltransferase family 9 protein [candidate division Zixibacteria bacterium]|nr:glycosyltransferase family 9 protein [candidate division Zixibacteria bacterium]
MKKLLLKLKPIELGFKQVAFAFVAPFLRRNRNSFKVIDGNEITKVLVLRPEKLGDTMVTLPLIDALKRAFPHWKLSILSSPRSLTLVRHDPRFDKVFLYRKNLLKDIRQIRAMRKEKFECIIDMICGDSVTTVCLSHFIAGGSPRIGQQKNEFAKYYDFSNYFPMNARMEHIIDIGLGMLGAFGRKKSEQDGYARLFIGEKSLATAKSFIDSIPTSRSKGRKIGYNLSAGAASRIWSDDKSKELMHRLHADNPEAQIVLIAVSSDRDRANQLMSGSGNYISLVPENLSFGDASAIVASLDLLISPDTSLIHVARSFKIPVVGFYPKDIKNEMMWHPYGMKEGAVFSNNRENIFDLSVDTVYETYQRVSGQYSISR